MRSDGNSGVRRLLAPVAVAIIVACVMYTVGTLAWSDRPGPAIQQARIESPGPRVVFIGDSYTVGTGSVDGGWVNDLIGWSGWDGTNLGVGGSGYVVQKDQVLAEAMTSCGRDYCRNFPEVIADAKRIQPKIVIVSGGRENVKTDSHTLDEAIPAFYKELRKALPRAKIFATSPLWDSTTPPAELAAVGTRVKASVESVLGTYLDVGQPLVGHRDLMILSGKNPNDRGYAAIARAVSTALPTDVG